MTGVTSSHVVQQVTAPVVSTVDSLLGTDQVATLTSPTVQTIDGALGSVADTVASVVGSSSGIGQTPHVPGESGGSFSDPASSTCTAPAAALTANTVAADVTVSDGIWATATAAHLAESGQSGHGALGVGGGGYPLAPPGDPGNPASTPAPSPTGTSSAGGGASGSPSASAAAVGGTELSHQLVGLSGVPTDDVLPSSPVAAHDSTPD
jgi:hypothetical protein